MPKKIVIAHRGACGYLPEHSMEAKAMAHAMDCDFIEQDVVMTQDDQLVVLHDHFLDGVTNVAAAFPQRARQDGRFYVIDFSLAEIQSLQMTEAFSTLDQAIYPDRFPLWQSKFRVHTLADEIELIQGLNKSRSTNIGIYPEIKAPAFHRFEGKDISLALLKTLKHYGYQQKSDPVFLQCFDPLELQRIKRELFKQLEMQLKTVQLIAETSWRETQHYVDESPNEGNTKVVAGLESAKGVAMQSKVKVNYDYDWMFKPGAMLKISEYADAIGPWYPRIVDSNSTKQQLIFSELVKQAHQHNLQVHPFTFRRDKGEIPDYADNFEDLLNIFYFKADVDGLFTDFPDLAVSFLKQNQCD